MQFTCESGRIVLCLKHHEWNKSAISSMFKQVASSADFVNTWETEIISSSENGVSDHRSSDTSTTSSDRSSRKCSTASTEASVSTQSSSSQDGPRRSENDRSTRKRSAATLVDLSPSTDSDEVILCGPPSSKKQCDYMSEGIDQRIERCRKGICHACFNSFYTFYWGRTSSYE